MAANIGPKIGVDGEAEYRKQMDNVIQQAKTLDSEMKLVASSFTAATTEEERNASTGAVLAEQIKNQEERVKLLADMVKKATEATGENSKETLQYKELLNKAQASLNGMEQGLEKTGHAFSSSGELVKKSADDSKSYKMQMDEIAQRASYLDSQMKLVASSFTKDSQEKKKNREESKILSDEMKNQKDKVQLLREEMKKSASEYGKNSAETIKWKTELNNAQAELNNMKTSLKEHKKAVKESSDETSLFGDILKANLISDAIVAGVQALGNAVKAFAGELKEAVTESAAFADEILSMSSTTGLSTEALQEYQYMSELADTSLSTITGSLTKLTSNMNSARDGTGSAADAFKSLGVAVTDENGALRKNSDVFDEVLAALGSIENETERDAVAMTIFGKSAKDLNPLIEQGAEGLAAFRQEAHDMGYVLDDEALESLGAVDDVFQRLSLFGTSIKNQLGLAVAPTIADLGDKFMGFAQQAVQSVSEVSEAFRDGGMSAGMEALGSAISDGVTMIMDKLPEYIEAGMSLLDAVGAGISDNLRVITGAATEIVTMLVGHLIESLPEIISTGLDIIVALANGVTESLPELIPTIVSVVLEIVDTLTAPDTLSTLIEASIAIIIALADGIIDSLPELLAKAPEIVANLVDAVIENAPKLLKSAAELIASLVLGIADNLPQLLNSAADIIAKLVEGIVATLGNLVMAGEDIVDSVKDGFLQKVADAKNWGKDLIQNFIDGLKAKWDNLKSTVSGIASTVKDFLGFSEPDKGPLSNFHTFAPDMMDLFMRGIDMKQPELEAVVTKTFDLEPYMRTGRPAGSTVNRTYGDVTFNIYTQPGQDAEEIADEVERRIVGGWSQEEAAFA